MSDFLLYQTADNSDPMHPEEDSIFLSRLLDRFSQAADKIIANVIEKTVQPETEPRSLFSLNFDASPLRGKPQEASQKAYQLLEELTERLQLPISSDYVQDLLEAIVPLYNDDLSYHGIHHAVDALQFTSYLLVHGGLHAYLDPHEMVALLLAAVAHDIGHPGLSVPFTGEVICDHGPSSRGQTLEEAHWGFFEKIIDKHPPHRGGEPWSPEQIFRLKEIAHISILRTDMDRHFLSLSHFDEFLVHAGSGNQIPAEDRLILCQLALKCADVSNIVRPLSITKAWAQAVIEEMSVGKEQKSESRQHTSLISLGTTQVAFIDFLAKPLFGALCLALPSTAPCLYNLHLNREAWLKKD